MALYRAQVIWRAQSGLPQDDFNTVLHFQADPPDAEAEVQAMNTFALAWSGEFVSTTFTITGASRTLGEVAHHEIQRGLTAHEIAFYRVPLGGGNPGSPFHTTEWGFTERHSLSDYPAEVALVLSYRAAHEGLPEIGPNGERFRARRRGRMYLPIGNAGLSDPSTVGNNGQVRPKSDVKDGIKARFQAFYTALQTAELQLGVYSQVDTTLYAPLVVQWVDNAWDTQRRRGPEATIREDVAVTNLGD